MNNSRFILIDIPLENNFGDENGEINPEANILQCRAEKQVSKTKFVLFTTEGVNIPKTMMM